MKRRVRRNVFETNSSSTHSFTYGNTHNSLVVNNEDNRVHTDLGEFGWEIETYYDSATKLVYILLAAASFTSHSFWYLGETGFDTMLKSFKETEEYKRIEGTVKSYMNCDGIVID